MVESNPRILFLIFALVIRFAYGESSESTITGLYSLFEEIGLSPACLSQTLSLCEKSARNSLLFGMKSHLYSMDKATDTLKEISKRPRNCDDIFNLGDKESGVRTVYPFGCCENRPISVYCDQTTDGGGWTVIQHREALPERGNFFRRWLEYQLGFGNLKGEFWLGLDNIYAIVSNTLMELRVDLEDFEGKKRFAKYEHFYIGDATTKYLLDLGEYSGNAGDSFTHHSGQRFSTKDQDNDIDQNIHCSKIYRGAWWYKNCHSSNLNGYQYEGNHASWADGINWSNFRGYKYSLKKTSLSLRPMFRNEN